MTEAATPTLTRERPPYLAAAAAAGATLLLYLLTIAPTTQFWDTSEYIAAAKVLGIPHPPGNPLFVLLAHVWGLIPIVGHYALRINLLSAISSALASGLLFLVAERFLRDIVPAPRWARLWAAFAGVLVGAASFTVWNQSVVNEKVYTLSLLSIALVLWLAVHWGDEPAGERRDHWLILIVYLVALSATNHLMGLLAVPAVLVYVEAAEAEGDNLWERLLGAAGLFAAAGVGGYLFINWTKDHERTTQLVASLIILGGTLWPVFKLHTSPLMRIAFAAGTAGVAGWMAANAWAGMEVLPLVGALVLLAALFTLAHLTGNLRLVLVSIGVVAVGVSVWAFLRLRAVHFPAINEGEPVAAQAFIDVIAREQYQKGPLFPRQAELLWQYANYLQYFVWQYAHDWGARVRAFAALAFGTLGLLGAARQWQRDKRGAIAMTALMATVTVLLIFYLDFKYGYSIRPSENLLREVRERDYFFIASFQLWGIWVALGFGAALVSVSQTLRRWLSETKSWYAATPVLLLALFPVWGNHLTASRADEWMPRDFAWDLLQSVEPYGILITAGDNDTFPLWYMQEVEGVRRDVLVVNLSLANTDWHVRQVKRREVFPFDTTNAISLYRDRIWEPPAESPLSLSYEELDVLPPYHQVTERSVFVMGNLRAVIEPRFLERSDIVTLQLIQDNLGKRPIYFSRTTGGIPDGLGFTPYLLGQGLARKLVPDSIQRTDDVVPLRALGWVALETTERLMFEEFHAESAARQRPRGWPDPPSEGILSLYAIMYAGFAEYIAALAQDSTAAPIDPRTLARATEAARLSDRMFRQTTMFR